MGFIFSFLFFILIIGLVILFAVIGFIRSIFGFGKRRNPLQDQQAQPFEKPTDKPKIFTDKEGEYVDYEEVE